MSKSTTSRAQKVSPPAPVHDVAPLPFKVAPVLGHDDAERALADELQRHRATHAAVNDSFGATGDRHPDHLPLISLLSFALCGEAHPYASSILLHVADDIESYRCAYGEGEGEEPVDPKAFNTMLWGWQRRIRVAGILAHREDRARYFAAKGGAR